MPDKPNTSGGFSSVSEKYARENLDGRLLEHSLACAETARELARRFELDVDKAAAASHLHDIAKPLSYDEQVALSLKLGMSRARIDCYPPPVLHGPLGALIVKNELGIDDPDLIQAIEAHTTGCASMCGVAKAVFIADYIEITRTFPGARELRSNGHLTLDELTAAILKSKLEHLLAKRTDIDPRAITLWNELAVNS